MKPLSEEVFAAAGVTMAEVDDFCDSLVRLEMSWLRRHQAEAADLEQAA